MTKLKDPNREPWEIVTKKGDPDHPMRNDGRKLKLAEENIHYRLMTIGDTFEESRRLWNGWACQDLTTEKRAELAEKMELDPKELGELSDEEITTIEDKLREENKKNDTDLDVKITDIPLKLNCQNLLFEELLNVSKFYFPRDCDFQGAQFSDVAFFNSAQFSGVAYFQGAQFSYWAVFQGAQFSDWADFEGAQFSREAIFRGAQFSQAAYFQGAQFSQAAYFNRTRFESETRFDKAHFKTFTPEFYGAEFHPDLTLPTPENPTKNWPEIYQVKIDPEPMLFLKERQNPDYEKSRITSQKNAYTELRRQMHELHKVEEEQFFYRQEMACQRALEKPEPQETTLKTFQKWFEKIPIRVGYYLYDQFSGYGWSLWWPLFSLTAVWLSGAVFYVWKTIDFGSALLLSSASTIPAFGTRRELLERLFKDDAIPYSIYWVSMLQTLFGFILIFVLLLAIRNRFRLR